MSDPSAEDPITGDSSTATPSTATPSTATPSTATPSTATPSTPAPSTAPPSLTGPAPTVRISDPMPWPPPGGGFGAKGLGPPVPTPSGPTTLTPNLDDGKTESGPSKVGGDRNANLATDPATRPAVIEEDKGDGGEVHPPTAAHEKNRGPARMDQQKNTWDFTFEKMKEEPKG